MSALIYPSTLPGLTFDNVRTPIFKTAVQEAVSGKETRISLQAYPRYRFELQYEFLNDTIATSHLKALVGLFLAMQGRADTFLFADPAFSSVTDYQFGVGAVGVTTMQLTAAYQNTGGPGYPEIIQNVSGTPVIKVAGVTKTAGVDYTLGATGIVSWINVPTPGQAVTWTGFFYYRCRFDDDEMSVTQFMDRFWSAQSVVLKTVKL